MIARRALISLIALIVFHVGEGITYPAAYRNDSIVENIFGRRIADPYRWLETSDTPEYKNFMKAQNDLADKYVKDYRNYGAIKDLVTNLYNYSRVGTPLIAGDYIYYSYNTGLQTQAAIYRQTANLATASGQLYFDPNALAEDGLTVLLEVSFSPDGKYMGYMLSVRGSEWMDIRILDTLTNQHLSETFQMVKASVFAWTSDSKGFFYNRFPTLEDGSMVINHQLYYHRIGTPQSADILVAAFPNNPSWIMKTSVSGDYVIMRLSHGSGSSNALYYADLRGNNIQGTLPWVPLIDNFTSSYDVITTEKTLFYILTNLEAKNNKIIVIDVENPNQAPKDLVPENPRHVLSSVDCVAQDKLVLHYLEDVKSAMYVHDLSTGERLYTFNVGVSSVTQRYGKKQNSKFFYKVESFIDPGTIYVCDLTKPIASLEPTVFAETRLTQFSQNDYETKQIFYPSFDGTNVPMFISKRKGLIVNENTPALLYGYGGFHAIIQPAFSQPACAFIQSFDGIFVSANIRGGGEYGEEWWAEGSWRNKQNSLSDFHAAAEYLHSNKYTSPKKLTIWGVSNGGLLVGACLNQRPDLYGAALPMLGLYDMLRYHIFLPSVALEYGTAAVKEDFEALVRYSPLHNVRLPLNNGRYPATLVLVAEKDDRAPPLHSLKFIAELQYKIGSQENPLMLRVEMDAGHGGASITKAIDEATDWLAFCAKTLQYQWNPMTGSTETPGINTTSFSGSTETHVINAISFLIPLFLSLLNAIE